MNHVKSCSLPNAHELVRKILLPGSTKSQERGLQACLTLDLPCSVQAGGGLTLLGSLKCNPEF